MKLYTSGHYCCILFVELAAEGQKHEYVQHEEDDEDEEKGGGRAEGCISYYAIARTVVEFTAAAVENVNGASDFTVFVVVVVLLV